MSRTPMVADVMTRLASPSSSSSSSSSSTCSDIDLESWVLLQTSDDIHGPDSSTTSPSPHLYCNDVTSVTDNNMTSPSRLYCDGVGSSRKLHCDNAAPFFTSCVGRRCQSSDCEDGEQTLTCGMGFAPHLTSTRDSDNLTLVEHYSFPDLQSSAEFHGEANNDSFWPLYKESETFQLETETCVSGQLHQSDSAMDTTDSISSGLRQLSIGVPSEAGQLSDAFHCTEDDVPRLYTTPQSDYTSSQEDDYVQIKLSAEATAKLRYGHRRAPPRNHNAGSAVFGEWPRITPQCTTVQNSEGDTLLHEAVLHSMVTLIFYIVNAATSYDTLNIANNFCQTPLHLAVHTCQPDVVRMLVARGARVDARDHKGNTPLHLACQLGCLECAQQLTKPLQHSENKTCLYRVPFQRIPQYPAIMNYAGDTCVHLAARSDNHSLLRLLLSPSTGHDVNSPHGLTGRTVLHEAVARRDLELLLELTSQRFSWKLDVNDEAFDGLTALNLAADTGQADVVAMLLIIGAIHMERDPPTEGGVS